MRKWVWVMFPFWFFSGVTACFEEGYPGGDGPVESDVAAQWIFDEPSGNIVDEVSGITLVVPAGSTYGIQATGRFAHLSPGISIDGSGEFAGVGTFPTLALGTNDFVIESWFSMGDTSLMLFSIQSTPAAGYGLTLDGTAGPTVARLIMYQNFADIGLWEFSIDSSVHDGNIHKVRLSADRDGLARLYLDEDLQDSQDISSFSAKVIPTGDVYIADFWPGVFYETRLTIGNHTNNSTPVWYP